MSQLLISQQYLREMSVIDDNVDFQKLTPIIKHVQNLSIKPLLGTNLYKLIIDQSLNNILTDDNKTLLDDYILDAMLLYIMAKSPFVFKFRFTNKGIMVKSSENSQPAETADVFKVMDFYKNMAEEYGQQCQDFIRANPTKYPTFFNNIGIDQKKPNATAFDTDIYLPDRPNYRYGRENSDWI